MAIDERLLAQVRAAAAEVIDTESQVERAKADHRRLVRHLHLAGASMREVAGALGISHQRVQQLVDEAGGAMRWRRRRADRGPVTCSFCGRSARDVDQLIAGPGVYICDRCVPVAVEVATTGAPARRPGLALRPVDPASTDTCTFCGKARPQVEALVTGPRSSICAECLELCQDILSERTSAES